MPAVLAAIDWTQVLVVGVPAYIAAIFAGIAMLAANRNRKSLKTSNGRSIASHVEATHEAVTESVAALDKLNEAGKLPEAPPATSP